MSDDVSLTKKFLALGDEDLLGPRQISQLEHIFCFYIINPSFSEEARHDA
jgi:hypothetical protein